ncbi:uncharacterized protein LOC135937383 [Cloeon dipterum]|uniref:uncharacterized protein LOC135937383 n=1 Tax=Cloeon dipterum TaxID=197152 RepID=UPI00321FBA2A
MSKVLEKWANFGYQRREIRTALVFGKHGENVIIVFEDDEVRAIGKNQNWCLGAGVQGEVNSLKRVENLCDRRIQGFESADVDGKFCIFAITEYGTVYSWGENSFGQLGLGTKELAKVPTKISGPLEQTRVVQVACGGDHTLALTSEGKVFAFGRNGDGQLGLGTTVDHWLPQIVCGLLDGTIASSVACQKSSSAALLHSGEICVWGNNSNGRLCSSSTSDKECSPCKVLGLEGVVISEFVCGPDFYLALSNDGKVFAWGENKKGQLGNGTTSFVVKPTNTISTEIGRVKDIAATLYESHPCAAITEKNQVYIWGCCYGQFIVEPMLTSFSSFDEVFALASPSVTYQRIQLEISNDVEIDEKNDSTSILQHLRLAFNNPATADFAFIVEGKTIHVHKNLLTIGSGVFQNLFLGGDWQDSSKKEMIVEDHSYSAFYTFLNHFYTDEVFFLPELALDVYALAYFYQVTFLMEKCEAAGEFKWHDNSSLPRDSALWNEDNKEPNSFGKGHEVKLKLKTGEFAAAAPFRQNSCYDQNLGSSLSNMSKVLEKWANFGYERREIRTALVFGKNGENVIIVFEDDEVLAIGKNQNSCLGAGVQGEVKELKRVENLCDRRIQGFECATDDGKFSIFAISGCGSVFSWGENKRGQLGLVTTAYTKVPTKISGSLEQKMIVQVACGGLHTLALTSEGEVYSFGRKIEGQLGLGTSGDYEQPFPQKVGGLLDGTIVTSVACQAISSFALLQSGEICAWGSNINGKLGTSSTSVTKHSPSKVAGLEGVVISQIVCGAVFTLALSDDGKIYSWGENYEGQLGNGTTERVNTPTIISTSEMGRVKEISATHYESHPCAAITEKNQVYIWGNCNGRPVRKPKLTSFSSFDEVYAVAFPPVTHQRFQLKIRNDAEIKRKGPIIERFHKAFNNPETADVAFIVEGKKIHVHKMMLTFGSDVFKNLFLGDWKDSSKKEQIIKDHSYDAFYSFLKYFYTDEDDFMPQLALDVYALAHFYRVIDLMEKCEKIIKSNLTVQNAAAVYEKAILLGDKNLCDFCFKFCKDRLVDVVNQFETEDCKREVVLEVFRRVANQKKKFVSKVSQS